jgi:hypothetical protein
VLGCWATLSAIDETIAANGSGNWPASYTRAALAKRIKHWMAATAAAYKELEPSRESDERAALAEARKQLAGPNVLYAAETAGNCKEKK